MRSSNPTINEIKDRLNVADVLSSYIQLKKSGTNYKAVCPFHNEKSASLMVSPSKQIWHCFGCGEGGDIFGFVMKYENVDFPEALKMLADRAGVQLPKFTAENAEEEKARETLFKINELSSKFYNEILIRSSIAEYARKYLVDRGLSGTTIKEWQIGFAPNEYHILETFLSKKGYSHQELLEAGVVAKNDRGDVYDRFFNRITFPIRNYSGEVVGFTARVLEKDSKAAKYVNSPETKIYNKSKVIFGLYQAKQAIRKEDCAVIVEGNMDVISCHQAGFKNVVASSGTAFTYDQLQTLSRLTKNLKFAFDSDAAGANATRRTLELALQLGFTVYVVKLVGAKDPDELIKRDPKLFAQAIEEAPLYLDYFFEKSFEKYDPTSIKQKKEIVLSLVPLLRRLSDPLEVSHYSRILAQRLNVPDKTVYELIAKQKGTEPQQSVQEQSDISPKPLLKSKNYSLEQKIIGYCLFGKAYLESITTKIPSGYFQDPQLKSVYEQILKADLSNVESFIEGLDESELAKMALFMVESEYAQLDNSAVFEQDFQHLLREFITLNIKIEMEAVRSEMIIAEQVKDKQKLVELNQKFLELSQALSKA